LNNFGIKYSKIIGSV